MSFTTAQVIYKVTSLTERQTDLEDMLIEALREFGIKANVNEANALLSARTTIRKFEDDGDPHIDQRDYWIAQSVLDSQVDVLAAIYDAAEEARA